MQNAAGHSFARYGNLPLAGLWLCGVPVLLTGCCGIAESTDEGTVAEWVAREIPPGTPEADAADAMKRHGFGVFSHSHSDQSYVSGKRTAGVCFPFFSHAIFIRALLDEQRLVKEAKVEDRYPLAI